MVEDRVDFVDMVRKNEALGREADLVRKTIKYRFQQGKATQVLVVGERGIGKSSTCFRIAELYKEDTAKMREKQNLPPITKIPNIQSHKELMKFVLNATMGETAVIDEVSYLYPGRRSMSEENLGVSKVLDIIRKRRLVLFFNCPIAQSSDKNIRSSCNILIMPFKQIKSEQAVVSRFWKLQTNYLTGKIYTHGFTRDGDPVEFMYTKKPNEELWQSYEEEKENFITEGQNELFLKAENKENKRKKELGLLPPEKKPLTNIQRKHMEVLKNHDFKEAMKIFGLKSSSSLQKSKEAFFKKGWKWEDLEKNEENS